MESEIKKFNEQRRIQHQQKIEAAKNLLEIEETTFNKILRTIADLKVAIPSWALGTGGTRFGRFPEGGEPRTLDEKIEDVALLRVLTQATDSISLHIPWDIPKEPESTLELLKDKKLKIDAVNSNTFQDQTRQKYSYKFGSLSHTSKEVRDQAIQHNLEVIRYGEMLGSKCLSLWLADGTNFPGQTNFRHAYHRTEASIKEIYHAMPANWELLIEYKPYEPNFYSMVLPDWGTSLKIAESCGTRAKVLVDLGHHLPNTNIEQIVARLMHFNRLGGFHFNGSQYGDDDLTTGSMKPYQLFLIMYEICSGMADPKVANKHVSYMIDASHNTKDPLIDLMQSLENIRIAYAKALLVDSRALYEAQENNDVAAAESILQRAFLSDVRPLIAHARLVSDGCLDPIALYQSYGLRAKLIKHRGKQTIATGL